MEFSNEVGTGDEGAHSSASGGFGITGVIFSIWRSCLGRKTREALDQKKRQRDAALVRPKHMEDYAARLERVATAA
jgi:hypothetical protein